MITTANIQQPDIFYQALTQAHQGLSASESEAFNARLILLLANQVGDSSVLLSCVAAAAKIQT
jgi:Protein of unknown function (DUF2783)